MLKNIVFDLGNVLVKFDSNELIYSFFNEKQKEGLKIEKVAVKVEETLHNAVTYEA